MEPELSREELHAEWIKKVADEVVQKIQEKYFLIEKTFDLEPAKNHSTKEDLFVENVIGHTCKYFGISREGLLSKNMGRHTDDRRVPDMRYIVMRLCRELPERSIPLSKIGKHLKKNHTTVIFGIKKCEKLMFSDLSYDFDYKAIEKAVNESLKLYDK